VEEASTEDSLTRLTLALSLYVMKIEIINHFTPDGREYVEWDLWDGPDGIDHAHGYAIDLVQAFSKIFEWRERIGADYAAEVLTDMDTLQKFTQQNETN
jgi:elongation factor P hydroxylase